MLIRLSHLLATLNNEQTIASNFQLIGLKRYIGKAIAYSTINQLTLHVER
ncbi:hypothetical protein H6F76_21995 [Leptolyngbya sp. FACHB-321]|nr:hypothetical protein [Leptolyngbya sp. FACHB-321]MBD2037638.1 hypothetical protein [Leptolyngbya sp. FACHB-321]